MVFVRYFDIASRCRQFAAAPRGGLQLAEARALLPPPANRFD